MFFRQKGKPKRKSKYKILDATDQESLELKPTPRAGSGPGRGGWEHLDLCALPRKSHRHQLASQMPH